jgi:surface antigen
VSLAGLVTTATPAAAAGLERECKAADTSCIAFSGYAGQPVWGFPVGSGGNNCVNYAAYRLARNGVPQVSGLGSGGSWASNARAKGFRVDSTASTGSIAQWGYGSAYAPANGHVGYVEEVTSSYIVVSDSAWSGYSSRMRIPRGDRNWPSTFIHFKDQPYLPPPSGSFLTVRETGESYRVVAGGPVLVTSWALFGGVQSSFKVSSTALASLPRPADGTFIRGAQRGEVYRMVGGAPVFVSSWAPFGGAQPTLTVDQVAIDRAGSGGGFNGLLLRPRNGSFVRVRSTGKAYQIQSGRLTATRWSTGAVVLDPVAVQHAGDTSAVRWTHLAR